MFSRHILNILLYIAYLWYCGDQYTCNKGHNNSLYDTCIHVRLHFKNTTSCIQTFYMFVNLNLSLSGRVALSCNLSTLNIFCRSFNTQKILTIMHTHVFQLHSTELSFSHDCRSVFFLGWFTVVIMFFWVLVRNIFIALQICRVFRWN